MVPSRSWSAIATGAALCKIEKRVIIGARKCRWSYGISQHRLFVEGKDDERNAFICPARNEKRAGGYVVWHIKRVLEPPNGSIQLDTDY